LQWLLEIFESKSDQARLVAILVSAVVAIFVVLLNQWFVARRARRELLISKIEKLYVASSEYVSACRNILYALNEDGHRSEHGYFNPPRNLVDEIADSLSKIEMICGLYFPEIDFDPDKYRIWNMEIIKASEKGTVPPEEEGYMMHEDAWLHVRNSRATLDILCGDLMLQYGR
jgi:hypothetical protein